MIIAFDNTFLSLILKPDAKPTPNPATGKPVEFCAERVEALVDDHSKRGDSVLIPTPCFAELLCAVPDIERTVGEINRSAVFDLAPFDARCAVDLADATRKAIASGDKKSGVKAGWNEVKFDRQIAVIAKVNGAEIFYTDDDNQSTFAQMLGLTVKHTWDLDLPPELAQTSLFGKDP
ncbi:hypothetical protein [Tateyamaria sp. SN3-11]|uniref:hypothetical protein n=1 Tax=Tateyamaria sp. SN3-11 TaxID=3092147 RepID=UPI0039ECFC0D